MKREEDISYEIQNPKSNPQKFRRMPIVETLKRVARSGLQSFLRNGWLSTATISVMALAIFVMTSLVLLNVITQSLVANLQDRIDISVYFKQEAPDGEIAKVQRDLEQLTEVKSVEFVTADEALVRFRERHQDNPLLLESLEELGTNPLQATLNIKAREANQFASIASFLQAERFQPVIDKVNYTQNAEVISRLASIVSGVRRGGAALTLVLATIAILVSFNTIRLAIYTAREEVGVMRLVGASNWFIRGPFLVAGFVYGVAAAAISMAVFFPLVGAISPKVSGFLLTGTNLFAYVQQNFWPLLGLGLAVGVALGVLSSYIAIRRYLKV